MDTDYVHVFGSKSIIQGNADSKYCAVTKTIHMNLILWVCSVRLCGTRIIGYLVK